MNRRIGRDADRPGSSRRIDEADLEGNIAALLPDRDSPIRCAIRIVVDHLARSMPWTAGANRDDHGRTINSPPG
jgi:hypothetical protein